MQSSSSYSPIRNVWRSIISGRRFIIPGFFLFVIAVLTAILISETANFLHSDMVGLVWWKAFVMAGMIEIAGIILIELRVMSPNPSEAQGVLYFFRRTLDVLLIGIFILVVGSASLHAVAPTLNRDNVSAAYKDKIRMADEAIASQKIAVDAAESALDAVKGQRLNSATRAGDLSKANARYQELVNDKKVLVERMRPDSKLEKSATIAVIFSVFIRILLQSVNWILAILAGKMIRMELSKIFSSESPTPPGTENVEKHRGNYLSLVNTESREKSASDSVREMFPHAFCRKNQEDVYEVLTGENGAGAVIGTAKNAPFAWVSAMKNLEPQMTELNIKPLFAKGLLK